MKWKTYLLMFAIASASIPAMSIVHLVTAETDPIEYWALIVAGSYATYEVQFAADAAYMYHVVNDHYRFNGTYYLSNMPPPNPGVNNTATKNNMRWAIRTWLFEKSDSNDIIFIFFSNHGGGYNTVDGKLESGRVESPSDEGNEHYIENQWKGVDECLWFRQNNEFYWDDELKDDLGYLASNGKYGKLIFVCWACYGGGFVDDLSGPNRIVMTATNETYSALKGNVDIDLFTRWSELFIEALHGQEVYWDPEAHCVRHYSPPRPVAADWSNDGNVSLWEAWKYAWDNYGYRQRGEQTPWIDDNGNGRPNYIEGSEKLDSYDGLFSMETYFGPGNLKTADINDDGIVNILDLNIVAKAYGSYPGHPNWNPLADLNNDGLVNIIDLNHVSQHFQKWYPKGSSSESLKTDQEIIEGTKSLSLRFSEPTLHKNQTFSVDVNIANITGLYSYELKMYYNKAVLNCLRVDLPKGHFLEPIRDPTNIYIAKKEFNNDYNATHGYVWVAVTLLGDEPGKDGDGILATITFTAKANAKAEGNSILALQDAILIRAKSLDSHNPP